MKKEKNIYLKLGNPNDGILVSFVDWLLTKLRTFQSSQDDQFFGNYQHRNKLKFKYPMFCPCVDERTFRVQLYRINDDQYNLLFDLSMNNQFIWQFTRIYKNLWQIKLDGFEYTCVDLDIDFDELWLYLYHYYIPFMSYNHIINHFHNKHLTEQRGVEYQALKWRMTRACNGKLYFKDNVKKQILKEMFEDRKKKFEEVI